MTRVLMPAVDEPIIISIEQPHVRRKTNVTILNKREHLQLLARAFAALGASCLLGK